MRKFLIILIGLLFAALPTASAAIYQQGIIYVIYDEEGEHSVKNKADLNANGVPDVIEDIATQINAARELFKDVFNFPDPLASSRFKEVTSIEIDILSKESMNNKTGQALSGFRRQSKHDPNERAARIRIANTVNPHKTSTPEHEYFHLVQYASTYFRNKWFLEGMASWSQDSISAMKEYPDGKNVAQTLESQAALEEIYQKSYGTAKLLWYPLAVSKHDKATIPSDLMKKYKYVDGSPVFEDNIFYGPNVMLAVLRELKANEEVAGANYASVNQWRKEGQRDDRNSQIIIDCVKNVYNAK